jgi:zinc protease
MGMQKRTLLLAGMLVFGVSATLRASTVPELKFEKYALENGLEVILSEDHRLPMVAVDIWYHVGAGNEVPGRSGFAHLFEHIMFQGSRNIEEDRFFSYLEEAGVIDANGTTDFDRTNYFETLPSKELELALWLESDRMGFLLDTLSQERLDNQRKVVRKERQQSFENVPYGPAEERLFQLLFPAPHPYNGVVIGSHTDLEAATLDDVKNFFKTWYVPNNATLVVVGDFDPKSIKDRIQHYFGSIPKGQEPPALEIKTEPIKAERRESMTDEVELSRVFFAWVGPRIFQEGDAEMELASSILGQVKTGRLESSLILSQQLAQEVLVGWYAQLQGSILEITITGNPGQTATQLEEAAWPVIRSLAETPVSKEELGRALRIWEAGRLRGLERFGGFGGRADMLNYYHFLAGDAGYLAKDFARMAAVTPESLQKVFAQTIRADNRVVVHVSPAGGSQ